MAPETQRGTQAEEARRLEDFPQEYQDYMAAVHAARKAENALEAVTEERDRLRERLWDASAVIERMANGASRAECSPELDRVIAELRAALEAQSDTQENGRNEATQGGAP